MGKVIQMYREHTHEPEELFAIVKNYDLYNQHREMVDENPIVRDLLKRYEDFKDVCDEVNDDPRFQEIREKYNHLKIVKKVTNMHDIQFKGVLTMIFDEYLSMAKTRCFS